MPHLSVRYVLYIYRWHVVFWLLYFIGWTWFSMHMYHGSPGRALTVTAVYAIGQGVLIYVMVRRWMPRYLHPGKGWRFALLVLAGLAVSATFISFLTYWLMGEKTGASLGAFWGYVLLGNTYWVILALVSVTVRDRFFQERRRMQTELRFLKSQMNPHFLFNALNSIYVLIRKDPDLAEHTLAGFSDMLRYQLYECTVEHIAVDREVAYVENFIRLEQLRRGDSLVLDYEKPRGISGFDIAPMLVFPLVENAFKYASTHTDRENRVRIQIGYEEPLFTIRIDNTTEDQKERPSEKAGGIGLKNLRRRLALLYPERHRLDIETAPGEYSATLQLQIR
ncbi:MAG TPA: histidine kinase [Dinghuibacter sp.]|uniref:sensor histidine kinase n=1 Tax=Dinghuibacter sp. TaxID=2024697 RepID=UPI002C8DFB77|nr:histidine kinase [Dinghuibacter sp.]HTJ12537.1 histidine kinase [Dinghuibacter sp.]